MILKTKDRRALMPWPMVHFSIAEGLFNDLSPEFLLGSLAPDSIHVRTNDRVKKNETHFMSEDGRFASDENLRDIFEKSLLTNTNPLFIQYLCGYIAHIYADRIWTCDVYPEYEKCSKEKNIYVSEVSKIEFHIYHNKPWVTESLNKIKRAKAFNLGGLLEEEVYHYRNDKVDFLENSDNEPIDGPVILSYEMINEFVNKVVGDLQKIFNEWDVASKLEEFRNIS
jgi:hypothetical protein